ncbi:MULTISPECIES: replication initiation protein [unclassified Siphonobacter]|uniref:replication initiation protein n=1 Tax=unclassified Siphonobacter TaxID=2635712 RepID=UPI002786A06D|nr:MULTISPECIES: replication initiation protein [unclassified Siphonobacter]MDQ1089932.1 plasmid replication initiation protein [Siphonobacter sp. SORGH_AS_1065]MDR6197746.1 plasmid replication initiation protein [Siphonobacter sp. SORGH_AS_0500]
MDNPIVFQKRLNNFQPNFITESKQQFSELEKRIVVMIINQIRNVKDYQEGQNLRFTIPITELAKSNNYRKLYQAAKSLTDKKILYEDFSNPRNPSFASLVPFPLVRTVNEEGRSFLEITMLANVVPQFIELGSRYTKYSIDVMLSLESVYSQRLYELMMMYYNRGQRVFTYSVEKLKFMLNCPESYNYKEIQRWALKVAQAELFAKANIVFEYVPSKKERKKILELEFTIKSFMDVVNEAVEEEMESFYSTTDTNRYLVARNLLETQYTFTSQQIEEILNSKEKLEKFVQVNSEIENGKITVRTSKTQYMATVLGFKSQKPETRRKKA